MITVRNLSKRFGYRLALQGVSLRVRPSEIVALLGPNGAGKSTLLRILATLARPTSGGVELAGYRLPQQATGARALIGYLGHQPLLYGELSAQQNLEFFARLYGLQQPAARIAELLEQLGLDHRRHEPVRGFSRGMQQRLGLARALLHKPRILLLDEPHSALDRQMASELDALLQDAARGGAAVLIATHDLNRVASLAQRVDILDGGRLAASLPRRKLSSRELAARYERALGSRYVG
jgi:heme exporter protein A